jgi:predicted sugar kinase
MLPALNEGDLTAFGEALYEFNVLAGEAFAAEQGGLYVNPCVAEAVHALRSLGVRGVGQSSWGPTVFALVADVDQAEFILRRMGKGRIAAPLNCGV